MPPTGSARAPVSAGTTDELRDLCGDTVACMTRLHRRHGPLVRFPKGGEETLFAFGPEASESLLSDPEAFHVHGMPGPRGSSMRRFGLGLFGLNGAPALAQRRLLLPPLARSAVEADEARMLALVERELAAWRTGETIDLAAALRKLALRVTGRMLFGLEDFALADEVAAVFQQWLDEYIRVLFASAFPVEIAPGTYREWLAAGDRLEERLGALIAQRRASLRDGDGDLLAILLRAQQAGGMDDAGLMGAMHTLFNASYQTTASGLLWTFLMLGQHPDALRDVLRERDGVGLSRPGVPGPTERAVREALRLFPPVAFVLRRATRRASVAGHEVEQGTVVFLGIYATHRDEAAFPDPLRYDPDRWLAARASPYSYIPFGAGPRMCMGTAFSMRLFGHAAQAALSRWRLRIAPEARIDRRTSLTLGTAGPVPAMLLPRDGVREEEPLSGDIHEMVRLPQARARQAA
ncbi:MAG: cytochrome P450 [Gemmataceae bacterium]|nr:cytochrome P450 [Gemmataceae bacterium]